MIRFGHTDQSGTQAGRERPRHFLSRPEQRRLLVLASMLLLVFILMVEARKPQNWQWLWGSASASSTQRGEPVARPRKSQDGDGYFSRVEPADLAKVKDNSVFLASETEVWDRWLQLINEVPQSELEQDSIGHVGYVQLFHQTPEYRGRIVNVSGRVRRAIYVVAPENAAQVEGYWQCWLFTGERGASPVVVYALRMPDGFPRGEEVNEQVEFTGLVYKRWAYQSAGGIRLAPLLLAKHGTWTPSVPVTRPTLPELDLFVIAIVTAAILGIGAAWIFWTKGRVDAITGRGRNGASQGVLPGIDEIPTWDARQGSDGHSEHETAADAASEPYE